MPAEFDARRGSRSHLSVVKLIVGRGCGGRYFTIQINAEPNSAGRVRSPVANDDDQSDQSDQSILSVALFIFSTLAPSFSFLESQQKQRERGHREITDPTDLTDSPVVMAAASLQPFPTVLDIQIEINSIRGRVNHFC